MKNEHALRYLLLRHIYKLKDKLDQKLFHEVAYSLRVNFNGLRYQIIWSKKGKKFKKIISKNKFDFYRRGDTNPQSRSISDSLETKNNQRARKITEEILGV